jgi:chromosome segregation ATPase
MSQDHSQDRPEAASADPSTTGTAALESRIAHLEMELSALRGMSAAAADAAKPASGPMPEIQTLHASLLSLADRLERAAAEPPAIAPERFEALSGDVDLLRTQMTDLCEAMATYVKPLEEQEAPLQDLAAEVSDLRKSVQSLILLVSQLVRRTSAAA